MFYLLFFLFLNMFGVLENENLFKYRYSYIIDFYKERNFIDDDKIVLVFNDLKNIGIKNEDLLFIDYNDFCILFLEYTILYSIYYLKLEFLENKVKELKKIVKKNEELIKNNEIKVDKFFSSFIINKIEMYIKLKKENISIDQLIDLSALFILEFSKELI